MVKGKTIKKSKKISKQKVSLPSKIKTGQITKNELKSVGFVTPDNKLRSSAPVESISGIGIKKGAMLRAGGIDDVGTYKKSFKDFFLEQRARKKPKPKPIKPKPKPKKSKPKPKKSKPKPKPKPVPASEVGRSKKELQKEQKARDKAQYPSKKVKTYFVADKINEKLVSNELHGEKEADIQRFINTLAEKRPSVKKDDLVIIRADTASEAKKKLMRKRKYYLVNRLTGEVASKPFTKHGEASKAKELINFPTHITHSKPENIDRLAIKVKRRFDALPKSEQDKMILAAKKRVEKEEIVAVIPVKKYQKEDFKVERIQEDNRYGQKLVYAKVINTKTGEHIQDWFKPIQLRYPHTQLEFINWEKEEKVSKAEMSEDTRKYFVEKKVKAPRKGNEYVGKTLVPAIIQRPKLRNWKNEKGKIRKNDLGKLLVGLYEAEYGKGSSESKQVKSMIKDMRGSDIYTNITSYTVNYDEKNPESFEFPH